MKNLTLTGRILFALPFFVMGLNHFFMVDFFIGKLTSFIPGAAFTIMLTGIFLIAAAISIVIKKYIKLACSLLALLLFIFVLSIHIPNLVNAIQESSGDKTAIMPPFVTMLKDIGLMGGALFIASIYKKGENEAAFF